MTDDNCAIVNDLRNLMCREWWEPHNPRGHYKNLSLATPIKFMDKDGEEQGFFFEYNPEQDVLWIMEVEDDEQINTRTD